MRPKFFRKLFRRKCSLGSCANLAKTWCRICSGFLEICLTSLKQWHMSRNVRKKNQLRIQKKWKKIRYNFSLLFFAKTIQSEKYFDITLSLKRSLHKPRKINELMNAIFGPGHEIYELK